MIAKKHGIEESTIRFRLRKRKAGEALKKAGRKSVLDIGIGSKLAEYIDVICNLGFSPTIDEILSLVGEFVKGQQLNAPQFTNGRPGRIWLKIFMRRSKLTLR